MQRKHIDRFGSDSSHSKKNRSTTHQRSSYSNNDEVIAHHESQSLYQNNGQLLFQNIMNYKRRIKLANTLSELQRSNKQKMNLGMNLRVLNRSFKLMIEASDYFNLNIKPSQFKAQFVCTNAMTFNRVYAYYRSVSDESLATQHAHVKWSSMWFSYNSVNVGARLNSPPIGMLYKLDDLNYLEMSNDLHCFVSFNDLRRIYSIQNRSNKNEGLRALRKLSGTQYPVYQDNMHSWFSNHAWVIAKIQHSHDFLLLSYLDSRTKMRYSDVNTYSALTKEIAVICKAGYLVSDIKPLLQGLGLYFSPTQSKRELSHYSIDNTQITDQACEAVFQYISNIYYCCITASDIIDGLYNCSRSKNISNSFGLAIRNLVNDFKSYIPIIASSSIVTDHHLYSSLAKTYSAYFIIKMQEYFPYDNIRLKQVRYEALSKCVVTDQESLEKFIDEFISVLLNGFFKNLNVSNQVEATYPDVVSPALAEQQQIAQVEQPIIQAVHVGVTKGKF